MTLRGFNFSLAIVLQAVLAALHFSPTPSIAAQSTGPQQTVLRVPLFVDMGDGQSPVPMSALNRDLKAAGAGELALYFEFTAKEKRVYDRVQKFDSELEAAVQSLGGKWKDAYRAGESVPGSNNTAKLKTCFVGDPSEVVDVITQLGDVVYSDQLSIFGVKYGKTTKILSGDDSEEARTYLDDSSTLWKSWKGFDDTVLMLASVGDDGTDVNESVIPACAP